MQGQRLGPYLIDRELGSGAMGTVYEAHDDDGNRVAVKLVHPHLLSTEGFVERFLREAEIGQQIEHPNVVRTLDAGEHDGRPYIALEYVVGGTLHDLRMDLHRVPETLCRHIGREAANGLGAIHALGIVHRDIKPENILITPDHEVRLMDLGLARAASGVDRLTVTGHFAGTPAYCPPEQFHGRSELDVRSDLYSLGATLYELATGRPPFSADSMPALVRMVMDDAPPRPGQLCTQLSPFFEEVLLALLEKDPGRRIPTADKLARVLEAGERSDWWSVQATLIVEETRRPLRRIRIPRETECVGRDDDLAALRAAFDAAKDGDGRVILLEGEAGIGKSRLIDELMRRLEAAGEDVNFLFGSYPPGGGATAAGAFSTAYGEQFGNEGCKRYLGEAPLLAPAFDALLRGDAVPAGAQPLNADSLKTVLVHATRALGRERPTVVVIDDLHFAPDEGRALFASLAAAVPGHPILLVGTARPGLPKEWYANLERLDHVTRSRVQRLGPADVSQLLAPVIGTSSQADQLATSIAATADGNPFFLFEIVRSLRESGVLTKADDGSWATTSRITEIALPETVQSLLDARIDRLSAEERELLECAACCGFEFDGRLVAEALGMRRLPALRLLGGLEQEHGLVRAAGSAFVFDHHAIQEHLYARLPGAIREELHAAVAEALEDCTDASEHDPDTLDGALCVDICEHYLHGARGKRALRYLSAACTHLSARYAHAQVVSLSQRALEAPGLLAGAARADVLLAQAAALDVQVLRDQQVEATRAAKQLADASGDEALRGRADEALGWALHEAFRNRFSAEHHEEAKTCLRGALDIARERGDIATECVRTWKLGTLLGETEDGEPEARESLERALVLSRDCGDARTEARALMQLGSMEFSHAEGPAQRRYEAALALCREAGDREGEAAALGSLGLCFQVADDIEAASRTHGQSIAIARECGFRQHELHAKMRLGMMYAKAGRRADAREHYQRVVALGREIEFVEAEGTALLGLAGLDLAEGSLSAPRTLYEQCLALHGGTGHSMSEGAAIYQMGVVTREQGDDATAERWFLRSIEHCEQSREGRDSCGALLALGSLRAERVRAGDASADARGPLVRARDRAADRRAFAGIETVARCELAALPGGDAKDALRAFAEHEEQLHPERLREALLLLWRATGDRAHLERAKALLDELVAGESDEIRESILTNLRIPRGIMAAWRAESARGDG